MKLYYTLPIILCFASCKETIRYLDSDPVVLQGPTVEVLMPGPTTTVLTSVTVEVAPTLTEVEELMADENEYRASLGQSQLTPGLTCSLYNLKSGATPTPPMPEPSLFPTSLPSATSNFVYMGSFNQVVGSGLGSQVLPVAIRSLYTSWMAIRCTGQLVIMDSGYHNFGVESDDAGLLYLDNALTVSNNGHHAMVEVTGAKQLHSGIHSFRIDYMQGNGDMGLIIRMDGQVIPSTLFYR